MRVLVTTAESDLRDYLRSCLGSLSPAPEVIEADNGIRALDLADTGSVDLLITNLDPPRGNGLELARALQSWPVPVLLLTTEDGREEAEAAGAAVLLMPFSRRQLGRRIEGMLSEPAARGRRVAAAGAHLRLLR